MAVVFSWWMLVLGWSILCLEMGERFGSSSDQVYMLWWVCFLRQSRDNGVNMMRIRRAIELWRKSYGV